RVVVVYLLLNSLLAALLIYVPSLRRYLFALVILGALALEFSARDATSRRDLWPLVAAVGILALAFIIWSLDLLGVLCRPASLLQGHAVWHLLGALSAAVLFRLYQSTPRAADAL
ncbi:MAG TPA: hypothetical protein VF021_10645, partial [Longimicrobiales bacterium]